MLTKPAQQQNSSDHLREKCALFGIFGEGMEAARITHSGLLALQHRGQESSGITSSDGTSMFSHKGMGLVAHVYSEESLEYLKGHLAIGHNRYATSGGTLEKHTQPIITEDGLVALAHNGNLPSTKKLEGFLTEKGVDFLEHNDSELMHRALVYFLRNGSSIEEAIKESFPLFTGAFALVIMTKDKVIGVRDTFGIRPLAIGKLNGGYIFASETCAIATVGGTFIRYVKPGEMVVISKKGMESYQIEKGKEQLDIFEFVYFARPDSVLMGQSVDLVRKNLGRELVREKKIKADVVIPVPDSAIPAAIGYAQESGIPFDNGLIKNRYIHRTFITPAQKMREKHVQLKLNPIPQILAGKDVVVIDDSIVRGTTSKRLVAMLRKAGAKKVHLVISSPPVKYPDFYGIDTPFQKDLIGANMPIKKIEEFVGADTLQFLSYEGMIRATGLTEDNFCTSCFSGKYPIDIGERANDIDFTV
ncbi:MAG: amidophosphoribosyltransferase [Candidatus Levyibacteriota bacterium]